MPIMESLANIDKSGMRALPAASQDDMHRLPQIPAYLKRNSYLLASLPGTASGPDSVMRQFNGGRDVPKTRLFVP